MNFPIFIDCGAPSLYNRLVRKNKSTSKMGSMLVDRKKDDFSFLKTDEYKKYRKSYIDYILIHKGRIETYVNLDVINNPQATWDNQLFMEKFDLDPIPVFHIGSDITWLKKYLSRGHNHIAIGGLPADPAHRIISELDRIWELLVNPKTKMSEIKVHGFAVTSPRLIRRYPWYSVDSTTWLKMAIYGRVYFPPKVGKIYQYDRNPFVVSLSTRATSRSDHLQNYSNMIQQSILEYINDNGFKMGGSKFEKDKEIVIEIGLCNDENVRAQLNAIYFKDLISHYKWPRKFEAGRGFSF